MHSRYPFIRGRYFIQHRLPWLWQLIVPPSEVMLAQLVRNLKPDVIHVLNGMQSGCYILFNAKKWLENLPPWIYSSVGSDLYWYGKFPEHQHRIREVLRDCRYMISNCERDIRIARSFGFEGKVLGIFPGAGGYPIEHMQTLRQPGPVSQKRVIALKGTGSVSGTTGGIHHIVGRAQVVLEALEKIRHFLSHHNIEVAVYQATSSIRQEALRLKEKGISVTIVPRSLPEEIYKLFGRARIAIGASLSDGVPNAMLEAMIMGAFPIQTDPGGATSEWIKDGVNGFIIPPDDPDAIAEAIVRALKDDDLVETAAEMNLKMTYEKIDISVVRPRVISLYGQVANES